MVLNRLNWRPEKFEVIYFGGVADREISSSQMALGGHCYPEILGKHSEVRLPGQCHCKKGDSAL